MFERVTDNAPWSARAWFKAHAFNGRLVIYGGTADAVDYLGDIWETGDGVNWTRVRLNVPGSIGQRASYGSCVHNRRLYVSNGLPTINNDVFHSLSENQITSHVAPWEERYDGEMCSFNHYVWVLGGRGASGRLNDVWKSRDGAEWEQVLPNGHGAWTPREDHRVIVHNGKIWIIGGISDDGLQRDVWYTQNGVDWIRAIAVAPFAPLANHQIVSHNKRLVVVTQECRLWHSLDGIHWEGGRLAEMPERGEFALEVFDNRIYLLGGTVPGGLSYNDVWRTDGTEI